MKGKVQGKVKVIVSLTLPHGKEPNKFSLHTCHSLLPFPQKDNTNLSNCMVSNLISC